jgi:hypothetical protein
MAVSLGAPVAKMPQRNRSCLAFRIPLSSKMISENSVGQIGDRRSDVDNERRFASLLQTIQAYNL